MMSVVRCRGINLHLKNIYLRKSSFEKKLITNWRGNKVSSPIVFYIYYSLPHLEHSTFNIEHSTNKTTP